MGDDVYQFRYFCVVLLYILIQGFVEDMFVSLLYNRYYFDLEICNCQEDGGIILFVSMYCLCIEMFYFYCVVFLECYNLLI